MTGRLRTAVFIAALLLFAPALRAQYDAHVFGHVLDKRTGEHLPLVTLQVKNTTIGCTTDESGHYFMKNLPTGDLVIVCSYVGYKTEEKPVRVKENTTTELNFELEEAAMDLENVVVTANRYETMKKETATMVNVVSPQLFETTSAVCMADALNYTPGLRVEQSCANCGQTELRMNGLEGHYSEILMDSRPIFSSLASVYKHYCLELNVGVKNVLDQYQKDLDRGVERDAGYIYGPSLPRTYFAGFNLKI